MTCLDTAPARKRPSAFRSKRKKRIKKKRKVIRLEIVELLKFPKKKMRTIRYYVFLLKVYVPHSIFEQVPNTAAAISIMY